MEPGAPSDTKGAAPERKAAAKAGKVRTIGQRACYHAYTVGHQRTADQEGGENMPIFGDLFDFDGDGKLNEAEQAAELISFEKMAQRRVRAADEFWFDPARDDLYDGYDDGYDEEDDFSNDGF